MGLKRFLGRGFWKCVIDAGFINGGNYNIMIKKLVGLMILVGLAGILLFSPDAHPADKYFIGSKTELDYMEYADDAAAQAAYVSSDACPSPISQWKMNDNAATTNVIENIGTIGDATLAGGDNTETLSEGGKINECLHLNGSDDYIDTNETVAFNFGTGDFSIAFWMNVDIWGENMAVLGNAAYSAGWDGVHFERGPGGVVDFVVTSVICRSTTEITVGNWFHVVGVRKSGVAYIYISGGSAEYSVATAGDVDVARNIYIGKNNDGTYPRNFDGKLDDVRVYDRALTEVEVAILYNSDSGTESSSSNLQSYSEPTIKQQGSYSLKAIALQTDSLNDTLTRTVSPTIDLSGKNTIKLDVRASRTGSQFKISIHDSGGTTTEHTVNIASADTWQTESWDISGVADANKDVIDEIKITILNAEAENIFYVDNMYVSSSDSEWSNANCWSATSGGSGGAGVPTSGDDVYFDSNSPACTIDANTADALNSFTIQAGYDAGNITVNGNIYTGNLTVSSNTGGSDTLTIDTVLEVSGNISLSNTGSVNQTSQQALMEGANARTISNSGTGSITFNNLTVDGTYTQDTDVTVSSTLTINDNKHFSLDASAGAVTLEVGGTIVNNGNADGEGLVLSDDTNTIILKGTAGSLRALTNNNIDFNQKTIHLDNIDIQIATNLDENGDSIILDSNCTFDAITLNGNAATSFTTGAYTATLGDVLTNTFGTITISDNGQIDATGYDVSQAANGIINLAGTSTLKAVNITNAGTLQLYFSLSPFSSSVITLTGNWSNSGTFNTGTGNVTFDGSGAQTLTGTLTGSTGMFYDLYINNSAATPSDTVDVDANQITVTNTLTVNDGQFQPASSSDFKDVTINTNGILKPDASAAITASGNWSNSGAFTNNSGTVTFDDSAQTSTISGSTTFYNFTCSTADKALVFDNTATQTIANTLNLDGGAVGDEVLLDSDSSPNYWEFSCASAQTVQFVSVKDSDASASGGQAIVAASSVNREHNLNWNFGKDFTGTVYVDEGVNHIGINKTVAISVNGAAAAKTAQTNASGQYTLSSVEISDGDVIIVYLDGEDEKGSVVTIVSNSDLAGLDIYQNRVIVRHDYATGYTTNANLRTADNADADIKYSVSAESANVLTVEATQELFIWAGNTYQLGGNITTPDLDIRGTITAGANTFNVSGSFVISATGTFTKGTSTITLDGASDQLLTTNSQAFHNLIINNTGAPGSNDIVLNNDLDVDGKLTITDGNLDCSVNNPGLFISGDFEIGADGAFTKGSGATTFNGTTTFRDNTTPKQNLGTVVVD